MPRPVHRRLNPYNGKYYVLVDEETGAVDSVHMTAKIAMKILKDDEASGRNRLRVEVVDEAKMRLMLRNNPSRRRNGSSVMSDMYFARSFGPSIGDGVIEIREGKNSGGKTTRVIPVGFIQRIHGVNVSGQSIVDVSSPNSETDRVYTHAAEVEPSGGKREWIVARWIPKGSVEKEVRAVRNNPSDWFPAEEYYDDIKIPAGFKSQHWKNDDAPKWVDMKHRLVLFVGHKDPDRREYPDRFSLSPCDADGEINYGEPEFSTNSWPEMLHAIRVGQGLSR